MRLLLARGVLVMAAFGAGSFQAAQAQWGISAAEAPCYSCRLHVCTCVPARPVVETRYRPEQVVTWQDVRQTAWRQEAHYETVAVPRVESVTVDEGRYETVWVPRPVTKHVAWTEYQQRLATRTVPVEVTHRVPQVTTRLVPEQSVRYVPQAPQTVLYPAPAVSSCTGCGPTPAVGMAYGTSFPTDIAGLPGPVPDPRFATSSYGPPDVTMTVQVRRSPSFATDDWLEDRDVTPSQRLIGVHPRSGAAPRFVPAPTAAAVWQSTRR